VSGQSWRGPSLLGAVCSCWLPLVRIDAACSTVVLVCSYPAPSSLSAHLPRMLAVTGAFHTPLMQPARDALAKVGVGSGAGG
jgi:hypothetical protein